MSDIINNLNSEELLKITIQLIRYHYENNTATEAVNSEREFKKYCYKLIELIKDYDHNKEITGYILAQMDEVPTFVPM